MKIWLIVFTVVILAWGAPARAEKVALTDAQMDWITAGATLKSVDDTSSTDPSVSNKVDVKAEATQVVGDDNKLSTIHNDKVEADNVINATKSSANTVDINNSVSVLEIGGNTQKDTNAVSIVNGIGTQVANGLNSHVSLDRGPGDLSRSGFSSGSRSSTPSIRQSNVITQVR